MTGLTGLRSFDDSTSKRVRCVCLCVCVGLSIDLCVGHVREPCEKC